MEFPFTPPTAPNWQQSVASTSRQFQQVPPFQSPPSQQYKLRPVPNNDSLRAHREMRELLARLQDDSTASGEQPRIEGQDECLDEESWFHMQNCVERIGLIANLINMPAFGNKISVALKRKLNYLSKLELVEEKDRYKAMRTSILIGQRYLCEFLHRHNDSHQTIATLWNAVRSRGCQFLGPAIQEEILKLVILALEDGESLTRKVLILFIMQRLMPHFPLQTSKTAIGHVIQILYRGSCFDVTKRDGESSLMSLKPDFRNYDALRREHDAQIVSIALEVGLRISPEQWSSLLYGDNDHKSVMQSIIDKQYKTNPPFGRMIQRLREQLTKFNDPCRIQDALVYFEQLAYFETNIKDESACTMEYVSVAIDAVSFLTIKILSFLQHFVWKMYDP